MGLRALLMPVTGHHADDAALRVALELGRAFGSHLSAICLKPDPVDIVRYVADWTAPVTTGELVAAVENEADAAAADAGKAFAAWRERNGLPAGDESHDGVTVSWHERTGAPGTILRDTARFADLVIMRGLGASGPVEGEAMLDAVLFDAGRPVLLTPSESTGGPILDTALVAWAGGREELRAITAALPILAKMRRVEIRTGGDCDMGELVTYLGRHGIQAGTARLQSGEKHVADALLGEAKALSASLLVMGAYHHSRTREAVFGGTTRQIISHVSLPVLLAH
ncbi:MAG TPA: universal stress protein [Alphaproteobacteria bacterium]|nr:universal stress protein [Alphaproteobacteria bacterium]